MCVGSAFASWLILGVLLKTSWVKIFLDAPDRRKMHQRLVPRMGGLGVILASVGAMMLGGVDRMSATMALGGFALLVLGLMDDSSLPYYMGRWMVRKGRMSGLPGRKDLGVRYKLMLELCVALVAVMLLKLTPQTFHFGNFAFDLGAWGWTLSVLWIVGVMNAYNLIDGIDGLCGGLGMLSLVSIAYVASTLGLPAVSCASLVVAGALLGFLVHNVSPARLFMGDMGSLFVGFTVAVLSLMLLRNMVQSVNSMAVFFLAGLPVLDVFMAIYRRFGDVPAGSGLGARLRRIVSPDSNHIHHRLLYLGLGHLRATLVLYTISLVILLGAVLLVVAPAERHWWILLYLVLNVMLTFIPIYYRSQINRLRRSVRSVLRGLNQLPWRVGVACESSELSDGIACQHRLPFEFFHYSREELMLHHVVSLHAVLIEQHPGESVESLLSYAVGFQEAWNMPMALVVAYHGADAATLRAHPLWRRLGENVTVYNRPLYVWPLLLRLLELLEHYQVARPHGGAMDRNPHIGNGAV